MNTSSPLHDRLAVLISETLAVPLEDVTPDLAYGSIDQWDSVGHLDLLVALESAFGIRLTADLVAKLTSLPAIEAYLRASELA